MDKELVDRVLNYRAKHNLSQKDFANLCGVTKATIWNLEAGKSNPTPLTRAKINLIITDTERSS